MQTRIRYQPTKREGIFRSVQTFVSTINGASYKVELNHVDFTYRVININQQECVKSSEKDGVRKITHLHVLKRQAKKALRSLGVKFDLEIRPTRADRKSKQLVTQESLL